MPLIDDHGRLFGRINIIDAALVAFFLLLVPMGYTASRLFRIPKPQIEGIEPATQLVGPNRRIRINGRDFRPFLKTFVSPTGEPFSLTARTPDGLEGTARLETATIMEVELPNLSPGKYDLYLFDETQEVARRAGAFALVASEEIVQARIRFGVLPELVKLIKAGDIDISVPGPTVPSGLSTSKTFAATLQTLRVASDMPTYQVRAPQGSGWAVWVRHDEKDLEADVAIPARLTPAGVWDYGGQTIRAGEVFRFQTKEYSMRGWIEEVLGVPSGGSTGQVGK